MIPIIKDQFNPEGRSDFLVMAAEQEKISEQLKQQLNPPARPLSLWENICDFFKSSDTRWDERMAEEARVADLKLKITDSDFRIGVYKRRHRYHVNMTEIKKRSAARQLEIIEEIEREFPEEQYAETPIPPREETPELCIHRFTIEAYDQLETQTPSYEPDKFEQKIVPPLKSTQKRIYLPVSEENYLSARGLGAKKERNFLYVDNGSSAMADCAKFLPKAFLPDGHERLDVELIPRSSWGASLANLLTETSWKKVRSQVYTKHGERCELCGSRKSSFSTGAISGFGRVEAHEIWEYHPTSDTNGIQKLIGLLCLCPDCHLMFHLGFAGTQGVGDHFAKRLSYYNGWADQEDQDNIERILNVHSSRSNMTWDLDVSYAKNFIEKAGVKDPKDQTLPKIYGLDYSIGLDRQNIIYEESPLH